MKNNYRAIAIKRLGPNMKYILRYLNNNVLGSKHTNNYENFPQFITHSDRIIRYNQFVAL